MEVFDIDNRLLGHCDVKDRQLKGTQFVVAIAEERGRYRTYIGIDPGTIKDLENTKTRHTVFTEIRFDITITAPWNLALIARDLKGVRYLPGYVSINADTLPKLWQIIDAGKDKRIR